MYFLLWARWRVTGSEPVNKRYRDRETRYESDRERQGVSGTGTGE